MSPFRLLLPVVLLAVLVAEAPASPMEYDTNRPGGDVSSLALDIDNPTQCRMACESISGCAAWSYVKPGIQGPLAMCWLKDVVPLPVPDSCCVSGTRPEYGSFEISINRNGGDYAGIALLPDAVPFACSQICHDDAACVAWTYVNAGVQGPAPMCWLKSVVPDASVNVCCTSGVK